MNNLISKWWRSFQFKLFLQQGNKLQAIKLLRVIEKSGAKLSYLERLFRDKLQLEDSAKQYKQETKILSSKLNTALQDNFRLTSDPEFIKFIHKAFNLIQHDENKLQCTGIDERIFDDFEAQLVEYLKEEFNRIPDKQLDIKLEDALEDINSLKCGKDPDYSFSLTPHVYYMKYFLENVYCVYLAWFLIYESGLLPTNVNILDIAAGPGTVAYGLALFLQSTSGFFPIPQMHISYYSLEKQNAFQFRGLQFWRRYIESRKSPVNAFFRFVTSDIFNWNQQSNKIPTDFFDFVVISHCFFNDSARSIQANSIYKQIINNSLINLRSVGYGNTEEDAKYDAMRRAVDMVLFQGIADHDSPVKDGLISNPERAKETHKSFFKNFYGQREYMSFIPNSVLVSSGKKAKGIKPVTVNMSVNVRALRKRLEREGIVRKFGL